MFKALTPILAIVIAVGLVVTHIQPTFVAIKAMERETDEYKNALTHAQALQTRIDERLEQRNSLNGADLERLSRVLPTDVDIVESIYELNVLANAHAMAMEDIAVATSSAPVTRVASARVADVTAGGEIDPSDLGAGETGVSEPAHVDISFVVEGSYEQLKAFLGDMERSLTLMEVTKLNFNETDKDDAMKYAFTVRLFSYNPAD